MLQLGMDSSHMHIAEYTTDLDAKAIKLDTVLSFTAQKNPLSHGIIAGASSGWRTNNLEYLLGNQQIKGESHQFERASQQP